MMKIRIILPIVAFTLTVGLTSCEKFLDTLPDNRIDNTKQIRTSEDIHRLLTSAYPVVLPNLITEFYSDNVVEVVENAKYSLRFEDQVFNYQSVTEFNNESPSGVWAGAYNTVHTANTALSEIERLGGGKEFDSARAEALLCRAYGHFILTNVFSPGYLSDARSAKDVGVPYQTKPEKVLMPEYHRESVLQNFEHIEKDLLEGLALNKDGVYKTYTKFHFNQRAAEALATRFYLYYQKWDKVIEYANKVLSANPKLRNYEAISVLPAGVDGIGSRTLENVSTLQDNNLLILSLYSALGQANGSYIMGLRYNHCNFVADKETFNALGPWGDKLDRRHVKVSPVSMAQPYVKSLFPKYPHQLEYLNKASGTAFSRTTDAEFTTDEVLLSRAEAYIMLERYEEALADLNTWLKNYTKGVSPMTEASILKWNDDVAYSKPLEPTPRKQFHTPFAINEKQEKYLQACLHIRRIETIHTGLRWYDIKRYGIEISRTSLTSGAELKETGVVLGVDDPRRAVQIPQDVASAGIPLNPIK